MPYQVVCFSACAWVIAALLPTNLYAQSQACQDIVDSQERLACYDRAFPPAQAADPAPLPIEQPKTIVSESAPTALPTSKVPTPAVPTTPSPTPASQESDPRQQAERGATDVPVTALKTEEDSSPTPEPVATTTANGVAEDNGFFGLGESLRIESTIAVVHRRGYRNPAFQLANGELWMQDTARSLSFRVGEKVTIYSGLAGGTFMSSERGASTRVRLIK